jgi:hypothetical protein
MINQTLCGISVLAFSLKNLVSHSQRRLAYSLELLFYSILEFVQTVQTVQTPT